MEEQAQHAQSEWLTLQEFADHFGVSTRTVTLWLASDPTMRIKRVGPACRVVRIHRSELTRKQVLT